MYLLESTHIDRQMCVFAELLVASLELTQHFIRIKTFPLKLLQLLVKGNTWTNFRIRDFAGFRVLKGRRARIHRELGRNTLQI